MSMTLLAQSWTADQELDDGLALKRQVTLTEFSGQIIALLQWSKILNLTIMIS